jgi:hypothetical protein
MGLTRVLVAPGCNIPDDRPPAEIAVTDQLIAAAILAEEVVGIDVLEDGTRRGRP